MLYENYYKKVSIIARILTQIRRFRAWFIGFAIAAVAAFCAFVVLQGTVYGEKLESNDVIYGEEVSFKAKALFRSVSYEFSNGTEFSETLNEKPKLPGEYCIRAVSKSFFGTPRYGKAVKFNIVPRPINVMAKEDVIVYGDLPNAESNGLVYEDRITCESYSYEDIAAKQTKVTPDAASVRVFDTNNIEVTHAYVINSVQTDIAFTPRDIVITIDNVSREYNGEVFYSDLHAYAVTGGTLASWGTLGTDMTAATYAQTSLLDVGSIENIITGWYVTHPKENKDVTHHYNISVVNGTLTVLLRPVKFNLLTDDNIVDFTYDAKPHSFTEYEIDKSTPLASGHKEQLLSGYPILTDVGQAPNKLQFKIFDADGRDVTFNHYCTYIPDNVVLKINPRPVNINMLDDGKETVTKNDDGMIIERVYDANELFFNKYEIDSATPLVSGHKENLISFEKITNVGTKPNKLSFEIRDEKNRDVTSNYVFQTVPENMTLKITPRPITVNIQTDKTVIEHVYDTQEHWFNEYKIDDATPLVSGHKETLIGFTKIRNRGEVPNKLDFKIIDAKNNDVTSNYVLKTLPENMMLKINPKPITLRLESDQKTYDGTSIKPTITVLDENGDNFDLFGIHDYSVNIVSDEEYPRINAGVSEIEIEGGSILIFDVATKVHVTNNYSVQFTSATHTVNKRDIIVEMAQDLGIVYDGTAQSRTDCTLLDSTKDVLANGRPALQNHAAVPVDISKVPTVKNAGDEAENLFEVNIVDAASNKDVSENYNIIEYVPGELKVNPRPIMIEIAPASKIYDATPLTFDKWFVSEADGYYLLPTIHEIVEESVVIMGSATTVAESGTISTMNKDDVRIIELESGDDVTANYTIEVKSGELTITPRPIKITADSDDKYYDDTPLVAKPDGYRVELKGELSEDSGLLSMHYISDMTVTGEQLDAGDGESLVDEATVDIFADPEKTESVLANYAVERVPGTLTVKPRPITIYTGSCEWTYDAQAHYYYINDDDNDAWGYADEEDLELNHNRILDKHTATVATFSSIVNFVEGGVPNEITLNITDPADPDRDINKNYVVTIADGRMGTLFINKRPVYVQTFNGEWDYDGKAHDNKEFETGWNYIYQGEENSDRQFVVGQTVSTNGNSIVNVKDSGMLNELAFTVFADGVDVTYNYNVYFHEEDSDEEKIGILTVNPREVKLVTESMNWLYDGKVHAYKDFEAGWNYHAETPYQAAEGQTISANEYARITNYTENGVKNVIDFKVTVDATGEVVDEANYKIYVAEEDLGTLTIDKRKIVVRSDSKSWTYDGEEHSWLEYIVEAADGEHGIVEGQTHGIDEAIQYQKITDVSILDNYFRIKILEGTIDVSYNYEISYDLGTLEITPRRLALITDYHMWSANSIPNGGFFDGDYSIIAPKDEDGFRFEEGYGLISRHENSHSVATATTISVIGMLDNKISLKITEGEKDVTGNYYIDDEASLWGILFLVDDIRITTEGATKIYDGTELKNGEYSSTDLSDFGCRIDGIEVIGTQTVVGKSDNNVKEDAIKIYYNDGKVDHEVEFTLNNENVDYGLAFDYGTLEVTLRYILVRTESQEWTYDAESHSWAKFGCVAEEFEGIKYLAIASGQRWEIISEEVDSVKNVADSGTENNIFGIRIFHGEEDVTENYNIRYLYGDLKINPRAIKITPLDKTMVYADRIPTWDEFGTNSEDGDRSDGKQGGLLSLHEISTFDINNAKLGVNVLPDGGYYVVEIVEGTVVIRDKDTLEDVTANYDITLDTGKLTITSRPITIHTNYHMWTTDVPGDKLDTGFFPPESGDDKGLVGGHTATADANTVTKITEIGSVRNKFDVIITNANGENVNAEYKNYEITYKYGMLFLTEEIKITTPDASKMYDGTPLTTDYTASNLIGGCKFEGISVIGTMTNVFDGDNFKRGDMEGKKKNEVDTSKVKVTFYDSEHGATYEVICETVPNPEFENETVINGIAYEFGTLTITKRTLIIQTGSNKWLQDGEGHVEHFHEIVVGYADVYGYEALVEGFALVDGHKITVIKSTVAKDVGRFENKFEEITIKLNGTGTDLFENYDVLYQEPYGILEIVSLENGVVIKLKDISKQYDGKPLVFDESCYVIQNLGPQFKFSFTASTSITEPGTLTPEMIADKNLSFELVYTDEEGKEFTFTKCTITFEKGGALTVTPKEITLKAGSAKKVYDGSALTYNKVDIESDDVTDPLIEGHMFYAEAEGSIIDEGEVENVVVKDSVKIYYIDPETNKEVNVTHFYKITYRSGTLTIE